MLAALRGSYVDYVNYMGLTEKYPVWFHRDVLDDIYMDESRYTFWIPESERPVDYYEKELVEQFSVFLRKPGGEIFCTTTDAFEELYTVFKYDAFENSGVAAFSEDVIKYVECYPGRLSKRYPDWFYEYFTESIHFPDQEESIFIYELDTTNPPVQSRDIDIIEPLDQDICQVSVDEHCVFLCNHLGEIRHMLYSNFIKYYTPGPGNWWGVDLETQGGDLR